MANTTDTEKLEESERSQIADIIARWDRGAEHAEGSMHMIAEVLGIEVSEYKPGL